MCVMSVTHQTHGQERGREILTTSAQPTWLLTMDTRPHQPMLVEWTLEISLSLSPPPPPPPDLCRQTQRGAAFWTRRLFAIA